jgi:hypothetical protein
MLDLIDDHETAQFPQYEHGIAQRLEILWVLEVEVSRRTAEAAGELPREGRLANLARADNSHDRKLVEASA